MENCDKTCENTKLPAKYEKFIVFSYWLSEKMKNDETIDFGKMTNIFSNVNDPMAFSKTIKMYRRHTKKNCAKELRNLNPNRLLKSLKNRKNVDERKRKSLIIDPKKKN